MPMLRSFLALTLLLACILQADLSLADDPVVSQRCHAEVTTLRLFFRTDPSTSRENPDGFNFEIAKLYVDDLYVGDAIVHLYDYEPTLRFPKSSPKIRIEMSGNRRFETKLTFLGHGSTQVLYVDFTKSVAIAGSSSDTIDAPSIQPFGN